MLCCSLVVVQDYDPAIQVQYVLYILSALLWTSKYSVDALNIMVAGQDWKLSESMPALKLRMFHLEA